MNKSKKNVLNHEFFKEFFRSKLNRWLFILSLVLSVSIYLYFYSIHQKIVFPKVNEVNFECYTDSANGGRSEVLSQIISDSTYEVLFKLNEGFYSPYIGISVTNKNDSVFNLASYDRVLLEISSEQVEGIGVSLFINDTSGVKYNEVCFYENLTINKNRNLYTINLNELKIPDWWYSITNTPLGKKFEPNFSSVNKINIGNANSTASESTQILKIYSIRFERDNTNLVVLLFLLEIALIFLLVTNQVKKQKKASSVTITYKPVDIEKESRQANSYLSYINNNFYDPNLTLEQVSHETGISQRKIANSIQRDYNCNFKTYVNKLRINESKRLLLESELNKGEIAYKVGFSNQTNFNRVFKSLEGITPSKFLEEN